MFRPPCGRKGVVSDENVRDFSSLLWLIIGKGIKNDFVNGHIVGIDKIMQSPIDLIECCYQFNPLITLAQQPCHYTSMI